MSEQPREVVLVGWMIFDKETPYRPKTGGYYKAADHRPALTYQSEEQAAAAAPAGMTVHPVYGDIWATEKLERQ